MKPLFVLVFLILLSDFAISQEKSNKLFPGFSAAPQIGNIHNSEPNNISSSGLGFLLNFSLMKNLSDRIQFQLGLSYQDASVRQIDDSYRWPVQVTDGEFDPSIKVYFEYLLKYQAIGIPAGVKLDFGKQRNQFFITGDFRLSYLFQTKQQFRLNEVGHLSNQNDTGMEANSIQLHLGTGLGYDFTLGLNHHLAVGPTIEVGLRDIMKSGPEYLTLPFASGKPVLVGFRILYY